VLKAVIVVVHPDHRLCYSSSALQTRLLKVFLHLFSEHAFEGLKDFVFVVFLEHVGELCNLFALLAARQHLVAIYAELHDLSLLPIFARVGLLQINTTQFVVALLALALHFVFDDFCDPKGLATYFAGDLVLLVNLHYDFGWLLHQSVQASWALVIVSLAADFAEQLATVNILALKRSVDDFLTYAA
jgi:hypothetical protein